LYKKIEHPVYTSVMLEKITEALEEIYGK